MKEKEGEEYQPAGAIAGGHGGVAGSRSDLNKHFSLRGAVAATGSKGGGECSTLTTAWPVTSHRVARQLLAARRIGGHDDTATLARCPKVRVASSWCPKVRLASGHKEISLRHAPHAQQHDFAPPLALDTVGVDHRHHWVLVASACHVQNCRFKFGLHGSTNAQRPAPDPRKSPNVPRVQPTEHESELEM